MHPACQSQKPNVLTLYRLFCQNALCQNSAWNVFKGNQLDKCEEKANQTAGFSSTCATHILDSVQQSQMDSPATQFRGDTCPGYFNSYSLSPFCPSIFQLLLDVVESFHTLLRGQLPTASLSLSGDSFPCRAMHRVKGWTQERVFQMNPPDIGRNHLPGPDLRIASYSNCEVCFRFHGWRLQQTGCSWSRNPVLSWWQASNLTNFSQDTVLFPAHFTLKWVKVKVGVDIMNKVPTCP